MIQCRAGLGVKRTGTPLRIDWPTTDSTCWSSVQSLTETPAWAPAVRCQRAISRVSPTVRQADHARAHLVADADRHLAAVDVVFQHGQSRRRERRPAAASCGCTNSTQRARPETSSGTLCIQELLLRSSRRPISSSVVRRRAGCVERGGQFVDAPPAAPARRGASCRRGAARDGRCPARIGPRSMPCVAPLSASSDSSPRDQGREPIAVRSEAHQQVDRRVGRPVPADAAAPAR